MDFEGLELLEAYALNEHKKTREPVDYYFFVKTKTTKEEFLQSYFDFLKNNKKIPLDILNSKIQVLDIVYIPFTFCCLYSQTKVEAEIGKHRIVKEFGGLEYNPNTRRQEVFYNNKLETDWHFEEFFVESKATSIFCENSCFNDLLNEAFPSQDKLKEKFKHLTYTDIIPEYCNKLKNTSDKILTELKKLNEITIDDTNKKIDKELSQRGEISRNVKSTALKDKFYTATVHILISVGYIQYKYDNSYYLYIKMLDNKSGTIIKAQCPEDTLPYEKTKSPANKIFFIYTGFWIIFFTAYWLLKKYFPNFVISNNALDICLKVIITFIILQIIDWFIVFRNEALNMSDFENKRRKYLFELFDSHTCNLKKLILKTDKNYKEI